MPQVEPQAKMIGRSPTVLVFQDGRRNPTAVLTHIVARATTENRGPEKAGSPTPTDAFAGPAVFSESVIKHIKQDLLPMIDEILKGLGLIRPAFEIGIVNAGGAVDLPVRVSGYSSDLSVCHACLSAALQIPLCQDLVASGHLASPLSGDIRMVRDLPAKLMAAAEAPAIKRFIYPAFGADGSARQLAPGQLEEFQQALARSRDYLQAKEATNLAEILPLIMEVGDLVLSSITHGYFGASPSASTPPGLLPILQILMGDMDVRFWNVLEQHLMQGEAEAARRLLDARSRLERARQHYPEGLGRNLWRLVIALPPMRRRHGSLFPLMPLMECVKLAQNASTEDSDDIIALIDGTQDRFLSPPSRAATDSCEEPTPDAAARLNQIIEQLSENNLLEKIEGPIDTAFITWALPANTSQSEEAIIEALGAYFLHLTRHAQFGLQPADPEAARAAAIALVGRIYDREGGFKGALTIARDGKRGGLAGILVLLTKHYKSIEKEKYFNLITTEFYDALPYAGRRALVGAFLELLRPLVPWLSTGDPDKYINDFQNLIRLGRD